MISWDRFWREGKYKSIVCILCGAIFIFSILSSLFVLSDIALAAEPEPMAICKHIDPEAISINKDDPPPIPDPDLGHGGSLSTPTGKPEGAVSKPEASCRERE